jgi:hypothetical protein
MHYELKVAVPELTLHGCLRPWNDSVLSNQRLRYSFVVVIVFLEMSIKQARLLSVSSL